MKTRIEEKTVMRMLFYPESNRLVGHIYDAAGRLKYRASVEACEAGSFQDMVVNLLATLSAKVESDPTL